MQDKFHAENLASARQQNFVDLSTFAKKKEMAENLFYKLEKMSGQTVQLKKIKTVALLFLNVLTFFVAFTVFWTYPVKK